VTSGSNGSKYQIKLNNADDLSIIKETKLYDIYFYDVKISPDDNYVAAA